MTLPTSLRAPRWPAALALALASAALPGCGLHLLARHAGPSAPHARQTAPPAVDELAAARARMADRPDEAYAPFRLAQLELAADSVAAAETALRAALARDASYAPALALLSKLEYESGRHRDAVRLLEPVRQHPEAFDADARAALLAGLALHEDALGHPDRAAAALPRMPASALGRAGAATVYVTLRGEHPDSATALAAAVLRADPHSAVNLNNQGIALLRAGDPAAAERALRSAIERDPALPGPYYNLALLEKYYRLDDAAAATWFGAYWARSHDDPDSLATAFRDGAPARVAHEEDGR